MFWELAYVCTLRHHLGHMPNITMPTECSIWMHYELVLPSDGWTGEYMLTIDMLIQLPVSLPGVLQPKGNGRCGLVNHTHLALSGSATAMWCCCLVYHISLDHVPSTNKLLLTSFVTGHRPLPIKGLTVTVFRHVQNRSHWYSNKD